MKFQMKLVLVSLLLISALCSVIEIKEQLMKDLFLQWKQHHNKEYTHLEEQYRYNVFVQNYIYITEFNANHNTITLGLNQFADLTSEEFSLLYKGLITPEEQEEEGEIFVFDTLPQDLPDSIDWRAKGGVTPVKNQGICGSCWAFSAVGALEGLYFINNSQLISFSEQNIIACDRRDFECLGGYPVHAFLYTAEGGLETEADYPYKAWKGPICRFDASKAYHINTGYYNVTPANYTQMKAAIAQQPVSVAIDTNGKAFQFYTGGVIANNCELTQLDHAVLVVGYEVINGTEAYIVKNSWGDKWGDSGYVYISTDPSANDGYGLCGILSVPAIPSNDKK